MKLFKLLITTVLLAVANMAQSQCVSPTFDNYTYEVVEINGRCWFAENLRTTILNDGTPIPAVTDENGTDISTTTLAENAGPGQLWRFSIPDSLDPGPYASGMYYNLAVARNKQDSLGAGVCPIGWKVPHHADFASTGYAIGIGWAAMSKSIEGPNYHQGSSPELNNHGRGPSIDTLDLDANAWLGINIHGFNSEPSGVKLDPTWSITDNRIDWFKSLKGSMTSYDIDPIYNNPAPRFAKNSSSFNENLAVLYWLTKNPDESEQAGNSPGMFFTNGNQGFSGGYLNPQTFLGGYDYENMVGSFGCIRCMLMNPGCTDPVACNYDPAATEDDGACAYPQEGYDCECDEVCWGDFDNSGSITVTDLLLFLSTYGQTCQQLGLSD